METLLQSPTVITALFLKKADAKKAQNALRKAGVAPENLGTGDATVIEREEVEVKEGFFHRLFHKKNVPDHHRTKYEDHVRKGATLIAVAVDESKVDETVDILNYYGARDFSGEYLSAVKTPKKRGAQPEPEAERRPESTVAQPFHSGQPIHHEDAPAPRADRGATDVEPFSGTPIHEQHETGGSGTLGDSEDEADLLGEPIPAPPLNPAEQRRPEPPSKIQSGTPLAGTAGTYEKSTGWSDLGTEEEEHADINRRSERRGGVRVYRGIHAEWDDRELDRDFETHHQQNYADSNTNYGQYSAAYRYGANMAIQPQFQNRSFESAEGDLERDFQSKGIGEEWARVKAAVKYGWERKRR